MFGVNESITASIKSSFSNAQRRLPEVHRRAQFAGLQHLYQHAQAAARDAGFSAEPLVIHWRGGAGHVAIDHTEEGDRLADNEFGHPDRDPRPNPVVRTAIHAAHREARDIYHEALRQGLL